MKPGLELWMLWQCKMSYNNSVTNKFCIVRFFCNVYHSGTWPLRILLWICLLPSFEMLRWSFQLHCESCFSFWNLINCLSTDIWNGYLWFLKRSCFFSHPLSQKVCRQCWECLKWSCSYNDARFVVCWVLYFFVWLRAFCVFVVWFFTRLE